MPLRDAARERRCGRAPMLAVAALPGQEPGSRCLLVADGNPVPVSKSETRHMVVQRGHKVPAAQIGTLKQLGGGGDPAPIPWLRGGCHPHSVSTGQGVDGLARDAGNVGPVPAIRAGADGCGPRRGHGGADGRSNPQAGGRSGAHRKGGAGGDVHKGQLSSRLARLDNSHSGWSIGRPWRARDGGVREVDQVRARERVSAIALGPGCAAGVHKDCCSCLQHCWERICRAVKEPVVGHQGVAVEQNRCQRGDKGADA